MSLEDIHFGTDGWRGLIANDFTFGNLRRVAAATAERIKSDPILAASKVPVIIGYDRRFFSKEFAETVGRVLESHGLTYQITRSPLPTPAISVLVVHHKAPLGIMITASHNPALYNGFKLKDASGRSAPPEVTLDIERLVNNGNPSTPPDAPSKVSESVPPLLNPWPVYESYLRSRLDWRVLNRLKGTVVFDYLHGTGAGIPEKLLAKTSLKLFALHAAVDPLFGGLHPEPIEANLAALQIEVKKRRALVGIAMDGDADRLGVVDDQGRYLTPHQVFPLLVLHCIEHKGWKGKIVQAVSLGVLGERIAKAFGLPFEEVPVGFKHVAERMLREDVLAGGEESGGYAVRGGIPERDGVLSGLLFLEMIAARGMRLSKLVGEMEKRFGRARFHRIDMPIERAIADKTDFVARMRSSLPDRLIGKKIVETRDGDGLKVFLENGSWVLLRPSGTEPLVRTYAESDQMSSTKALLTWAGKSVRQYLGQQS